MGDPRNTHRSDGLEAILANIEYAHRLTRESDSVKIVAVVSGSDVDRDNWEEMLSGSKDHLFNADGSTVLLSFREKAGQKEKEGNMLGTLLAYRKLRKSFPAYRSHVAMLGMLFGRGERMSPITQALGDRKPGVVVTPGIERINGVRRGYTAIEEGMMYFTPVAKYLEKRGFRGVLDKWGDET